MSLLLHFVFALAVILAVAWAVGRAFALAGQPPVMGEVIGGVLLGPSCLGWAAPTLFAALFPASVVSVLGVYAQVGIVLYMFVVGLDVDLPAARKRGVAVVVVAQCGFWTPFLGGALLAVWVRPLLRLDGAPAVPFALFLGLALAVTAFPLLARMLRDARVDRTKVGSLALAAAAVGDVTVWCLLAVVVGIAGGTLRSGVSTLAAALIFLSFLWWIGAPVASRLLERWYQNGRHAAALGGLACVLAAAAWGADLVGIHALFGTFVLGASLSRSSAVAVALTNRVERPLAAVCLPVFFAFTGLRTAIGSLVDARSWLLCAAIVVVACVTKMAGAFVGGRASGLTGRESSALALLMNARGLVGLIIFNIGLDAGLISTGLFTMLVLMDLVTTLMTGPVLRLMAHKDAWGLAIEGA